MKLQKMQALIIGWVVLLVSGSTGIYVWKNHGIGFLKNIGSSWKTSQSSSGSGYKEAAEEMAEKIKQAQESSGAVKITSLDDFLLEKIVRAKSEKDIKNGDQYIKLEESLRKGSGAIANLPIKNPKMIMGLFQETGPLAGSIAIGKIILGIPFLSISPEKWSLEEAVYLAIKANKSIDVSDTIKNLPLANDGSLSIIVRNLLRAKDYDNLALLDQLVTQKDSSVYHYSLIRSVTEIFLNMKNNKKLSVQKKQERSIKRMAIIFSNEEKSFQSSKWYAEISQDIQKKEYIERLEKWLADLQEYNYEKLDVYISEGDMLIVEYEKIKDPNMYIAKYPYFMNSLLSLIKTPNENDKSMEYLTKATKILQGLKKDAWLVKWSSIASYDLFKGIVLLSQDKYVDAAKSFNLELVKNPFNNTAALYLDYVSYRIKNENAPYQIWIP